MKPVRIIGFIFIAGAIVQIITPLEGSGVIEGIISGVIGVLCLLASSQE